MLTSLLPWIPTLIILLGGLIKLIRVSARTYHEVRNIVESVDRLEAEVRTNHGSSLKDSVLRLERRHEELNNKLEKYHDEVKTLPCIARKRDDDGC